MHTLKLRHEISIHALTTKVWSILTRSEYAGQVLFDGELISDWTKGSHILLEVEKGGSKEVQKKGIVDEVVPGISLQFTLYELGAFSNDPVGFLYELYPEEGGVKLILTQEAVLPKEELYQLMAGNSKMMLQKIKWLAEYS
jgi:hypothetical protein